ncbi:hypothetical protein GCM10010461_14030 [Microbacterium aurantiacum]
MLFIAFAYRELNNAVPDCGTTFTWGTKAFGPWVGWMGGWGVAVAGMVVLANLAQIGGIYFWALVDGIIGSGQDALLSDNVPLVTATGVVFVALMTWISWRGVEIGERVQNVLLAIQYLALAIFVVAALWQYFAGSAPGATPFAWDWFNPFAFEEWSGFTEAILLALFIYWGWGTCLALNEETKDPKRIPGLAALLTCVLLLFTYVSVTVAAMMYAGLGDTGTGLGNEANADDFFLAIKDGLLGPVGWVLVVAVLISAVSSTQTTILPTARGTLAMGVYRALPARFKTVVRRGLRLHGALRHRGDLRPRGGVSRPRGGADGAVVPVPALEAVLPRREPEPGDAGDGAGRACRRGAVRRRRTRLTAARPRGARRVAVVTPQFRVDTPRVALGSGSWGPDRRSSARARGRVRAGRGPG